MTDHEEAIIDQFSYETIHFKSTDCSNWSVVIKFTISDRNVCILLSHDIF